MTNLRSAPGPRGWVLRSSLDGFGSTIDTREVFARAPTFDALSVDPSTGFQDLRGELTFRLYGFGPGAGQGLFFDDIVLDGAWGMRRPRRRTTATPLARRPGVVGRQSRRGVVSRWHWSRCKVLRSRGPGPTARQGALTG